MVNHQAVIILAAGMGKRMRSPLPKVLHQLQQRPMIFYILRVARKLVGDRIFVVVGHQADLVKDVIAKITPVRFVYQEQQLGTGHAVRCAMPYLPSDVTEVVILCGDTPLIRCETIQKILQAHITEGSDISVLTTRVDNPTGYGRIVRDKSGELLQIVEEVDADFAQKQIQDINTGIYVIRTDVLRDLVEKITCSNAQNEFYLTDIVRLGKKENYRIRTVVGEDPMEILGINSAEDLIKMEDLLQERKIKLLDFDSPEQL